MKYLYPTLLSILIVFILSCKKNDSPKPAGNGNNNTTDNYSSLNDFYLKNTPATTTFTVSGDTGGTFTTSKGTKLYISHNAFLNKNVQVITSKVQLQYKEIDKKSETILCGKPTSQLAYPYYFKFGGGFFIKATAGGEALKLNTFGTSHFVKIALPTNGIVDMNMIALKDTFNDLGYISFSSWNFVSGAGISFDSLNHYLYSVYDFKNTPDSGYWGCAGDFQAYTSYNLSSLKIETNDTTFGKNLEVFIVFKDFNTSDQALVEINDKSKYFASDIPEGIDATVVAVGVKDGKLYSAFLPITTSSTLHNVTIKIAPTTATDFKTQLSALD